MPAYVLRRLALLVPTLLGIVLATFALLRLAPGDPAEIALASREGQEALDPEALARFRSAYLLDEPMWRQFLHYLGPFDLSGEGHRWFGGTGERPYGGLLCGDFKRELHRPNVRIVDELLRRLRVTVPLSLAAMLLAYLAAIPLGVVSAVRRDGWVARAGTLVSFLCFCVPSFLAALGLQLLFGRTGLGWLPATGTGEGLVGGLRHAVLPVLTLGYGTFAYVARQMRAGMLETLSAEFLRAARARGLPERVVIGRHALCNALIPVATLSAGVLPALIGGSVVVETIFDLPGVGRYAYEGLQNRDVFIVLATTTLTATMTCLGILLADLLCAALDPRIRHG